MCLFMKHDLGHPDSKCLIKDDSMDLVLPVLIEYSKCSSSYRFNVNAKVFFYRNGWKPYH